MQSADSRVCALMDSVGNCANGTLMNALRIPAKMELLATIMSTPTPVNVRLDFLEQTVIQTMKIAQ